jgi:hypothetical protein
LGRIFNRRNVEIDMPNLIIGGKHSDERGELLFNNNFDTSEIKRIYIIEHKNNSFERGWQGHKREQRWFSAMKGSFIIKLIAVDDWSTPSKNLTPMEYVLEGTEFNVLHVPAGYITSIRSIKDESKLMVMSDYFINEINDEYRFPIDYFIRKNK